MYVAMYICMYLCIVDVSLNARWLTRYKYCIYVVQYSIVWYCVFISPEFFNFIFDASSEYVIRFSAHPPFPCVGPSTSVGRRDGGCPTISSGWRTSRSCTSTSPPAVAGPSSRPQRCRTSWLRVGNDHLALFTLFCDLLCHFGSGVEKERHSGGCHNPPPF